MQGEESSNVPGSVKHVRLDMFNSLDRGRRRDDRNRADGRRAGVSREVHST
jgi:hypothetical protein